MGLTTACARSSSPLVTPPSRPPARLLGRCTPRASSKRISSWKAEPGVSPPRKPAPSDTAFTAWIDIRAWARRPSRRRSQCANEPRPGGTPCATTSKTPPTVSPAFFAASISAIMASEAFASTQRTALSSTAASASHGGASPERAARPMRMTWLRTSTPAADSRALASPPAATRAVVSRAEARSRTSRRSSVRYFRAPARSACPGRGCLRARRFFASGGWGSGDITSRQFSWSRLRMSRVTGLPRVAPWRTPESTSTWSLSIFMRPPRP